MATLADTHAKLSKNNDPKDLPVDVDYRRVVGCLIYATIITHPDIAYTVNKVSLFQEQPQQSHYSETNYALP